MPNPATLFLLFGEIGGGMSKRIGDLASFAGVVVRNAPGLLGAVCVAAGSAWAVHVPAVGLIVAGAFAMAFGREM